MFACFVPAMKFLCERTAPRLAVAFPSEKRIARLIEKRPAVVAEHRHLHHGVVYRLIGIVEPPDTLSAGKAHADYVAAEYALADGVDGHVTWRA